MPKVNFIKENIVIEVEEGTKLIDCIRKAGLKIETPCNCIGVCGKCKVKAFGKLYSKTDEEYKHTENDSIRLACIAKVKGDVTVELLKEEKSLKTINRGFSIQTEVDSSIKRSRMPLFDEKNFVPYKDVLDFNVSDINVIKDLALIERKKNKELYGITFNNELLETKEFIDTPLGVSIDIGTTGISAYLVDLESGEVLNKASALNPQTEFGGDVISRITYCIQEENGVDILSKCIRKKINSVIKELVQDE
ncbi:2Fe-2S iron-sulfur cluster binding domain-containing protein, partial [Clostridiaceae bacterium UIB06]|nr:2Fe-2S iron-sulfur cluster binding domain-containing protein [Clostridiaceae bacterium UIB06]